MMPISGTMASPNSMSTLPPSSRRKRSNRQRMGLIPVYGAAATCGKARDVRSEAVVVPTGVGALGTEYS